MEGPNAWRRTCAALCLTAVLAVLAGCDRDEQTVAPPPLPTPSVTLRVLVVNDPPLAEAIERLRGEWAVRSGGQLEATSKPWSEVESADSLDADVVVFPARYLGTLCERGWLRPVRDSVLRGETYDAADVFPLVRGRLVRYGGQTMALPLGVEMPLVGYRAESLAGRQGEPPRSWDDFGQLLDQSGVTPHWWPPRDAAQHWGATMLLARAAAYATHPNREGVLFDPHSMRPRIAEPPFIRALDRWCGEPSAAVAAAPADVVWAALPGSAELYNHSTGEWERAERGVRQVPLVGGGGSLIGVTQASRNAATAFQLAAWLSSAEISGQLGPKVGASLPCRYSQMRALGGWLDGFDGRTSTSGLSRDVERALSGEACLVVPPLPGIDGYLAALDEAVKGALRGERSPDEALQEVARRWDELTDQLGHDRQRTAYLKHLGIVEP